MRNLFSLLVSTYFLIISCNSSNNSANTTVPEAKIIADKSVIPFDSSTLYFPIKSFDYSPTNVSLDSFVVQWFSEQLFALREPVLYTDKSPTEIYRFTWLRSFHNPIAIRIEKEGEQCFLFWKLSDGAGGYSPGKLKISNQKMLENNIWDAFLVKLKNTDFWNMPVIHEMTGTDGAEWILEGKSQSRYHVIEKWSPDHTSKYYDCCNFLLGLTNLKIPDSEKY